MSDITRLEDELFPEEHQSQGFLVDSAEKAEWALSKIARSEHRIQELAALAEAAKARIDARLEEITKADRATVARLGDMIRPWASVEVAQNGKRKSIQLLNGTVGFRQSPASLVVTDEAAAVAWLEANGGAFVRVKKSVDKLGLKKAIEEGGPLPDGVELPPAEVNFYVEARRAEIAHKEASNE